VTATLPLSRFGDRVGAAVGDLRAAGPTTLQVNVGKRCNQACRHCHVDASPTRTEVMPDDVLEACLDALARTPELDTLDVTGGAPELHPRFRELVSRARALGRKVMVRHNLTVQHEPGQGDLPAFFAAHGVEVVCSLPHYTEEATDRQRGRGVFAGSIAALRALNAVGYARDPALVLNLVSNPVGAFLPPAQADLERDTRAWLRARHGVEFNALFTITNMPIARFADWLRRAGTYDAYMARLEAAFNPATVPGLMCRSLVSVGYDGRLYDCDFNQMLELGLEEGRPSHIRDFDRARLAERRVSTGEHCFGCTAGAGSSCGGALA
jgi:radical SAM/Cys-rich protein